MTVTDFSNTPVKASSAVAHPAPRVRDPRLDFFRGIAMFIILIAHTPGNWLTLWIPARFGFSDATEIFVFCSGMASAIAFGGSYHKAGWAMGTARIGYRIWQVYWAHIALFFATVALTVFMTEQAFTTRNYWGQLNLWALFVESEKWENSYNLFAILTLTWVPNYFDILPMYIVVLMMMPVVMLLHKVHVALVFAASIGLWLATQIWSFGLPAEPWSDRQWFFNPFGWQLIFYTGFAFMLGWIPAPKVRWWLIALALVIVLATVPLAWGRYFRDVEAIVEWREAWGVLFNKTDFGILRFVHFLALAYIAWAAVGEKGRRLVPQAGGVVAIVWSQILLVIMTVGQQSLAVFVSSMFLARALGMLLDVFGRSYWTMTWVNLLGACLIIGVAFGAKWFKGQPWKAKRIEGDAHASA